MIINLIPSNNIKSAFDYILNVVKNFEIKNKFSSMIFTISKSQQKFIINHITSNFSDLSYLIGNLSVFQDFIINFYWANKIEISKLVNIDHHKSFITEIFETNLLLNVIRNILNELKYFNIYFHNKIKYDLQGNYGILSDLLKFIKIVQTNYLENQIISDAMQDEYGILVNEKLNDFITIKDNFLNYLIEKKYFTVEDIKLSFDEFISISKQDIFQTKIENIFFTGISYLTNNEKNIIKNIILKSKNKTVYFTLPEKIIELILSDKFDEPILEKKYKIAKNIIHLLFEMKKNSKFSFNKIVIPLNQIQPHYEIYSFKNKQDEMNWICNDIKYNSNLNNNYFDNSIIITPNISRYENTISNTMEEFSLDYEITKGTKLLKFRIITILKNIFEFILYFDSTKCYEIFSSYLFSIKIDFDSNRLTEYFKNIFDMIPNNEYRTIFIEQYEFYKQSLIHINSFDIQIIDSIARKYGISNYISENIARLKSKLIKNLLFDIENAEAQINSREVISRTIIYFHHIFLFESELAKFQNYKNNILKNPDYIKEFINIILIDYNFLNNFIKIFYIENTDETSNILSEQIEKNLYALSKFLKLLDEVNFILKDNFYIQKNNEPENILEYIFYILDLVCFNSTVNISNKFKSIKISELLELRNICYDTLYLVGLISDDFPLSSRESILFPENIEYYKYNFIDYISESEFIFSELTENFKRIIFTFPEYHNEAKLQISPILEEFIINKNIEIKKPDMTNIYRFTKKFEIKNNILSLKNYILSNNQIATSSNFNFNSNQFDYLMRFIKYYIKIKDLKNFTEYEANLRTELNDFFYENISKFNFSAVMLNSYVSCPLSFFFKYLLHLKELEEQKDLIERNKIGSLIHIILKNYFEKNIKNSNLKNILKNHYEELYVIADNLIESEVYGEPEYLKLFFDKYFSQTENCIMKKFVEYDKEFFKEHKNYLNEYKFKDKILFDENNYINISGVIDRIDIDEQRSNVSIIDYKTGNYNKLETILKGKEYQLSLYYLFIRNSEEFKNYKKINTGYYNLKSLNKLSFDPIIIKENNIENKIDELILLHNLFYVKSHIFNSNFNYADTCENSEKNCVFENICRKSIHNKTDDTFDLNIIQILYNKFSNIKKIIRDCIKHSEKKINRKNTAKAVYKRIDSLKNCIDEYENILNNYKYVKDNGTLALMQNLLNELTDNYNEYSSASANAARTPN